jgi:DNA polymerase III epsilon subunit-like protein
VTRREPPKDPDEHFLEAGSPVAPNGPNKILVFDVETTGLDPARNAIVEIGAVLLDERLQIIDEFSRLVSPWEGAVIVQESMAVHKIKPESLKNAESVSTVITEFHERYGSVQLLPWLAGWNAWFDVAFLQSHYGRAGIAWPFSFHFLDVQSLVLFFSRFRGASLNATIRNLFGKIQSHRALDDARYTARILEIMGREHLSMPSGDAAK